MTDTEEQALRELYDELAEHERQLAREEDAREARAQAEADFIHGFTALNPRGLRLHLAIEDSLIDWDDDCADEAMVDPDDRRLEAGALRPSEVIS